MTIESESLIEIDEEKYAAFLGEYAKRGIKAQQTLLERSIERDVSLDSLATLLSAQRSGAPDGYRKNAEVMVLVDVEEHCEKHDEWFSLDPARLAYCWQCKAEARQ